MPIINQEKWNTWVEKNQEPYGKACVDTARRVMELLDTEKEFDCHDLICRADKEAGAGGLTGFMAGVVSQMVSVCHSRGQEFKEKWNKGYGSNEKKGVINPAIFTIRNNP